MKVFSMFSGIGGFEKGIKDAIPDAEIVGHSELGNKGQDGYYADMVYRYHYPKSKNYGDCTKIDTSLLPGFDMLCGGFPCQSFSIAGKRGGIYNDKQARGTLFYEIMRIAKAKKPRIIFLENVKGLLSSGYGFDYAEIIGELKDTMVQLWGDEWEIQWECLNTKNFGIPQNRERVFIVARYTGEGSTGKIFPIGQSGKRINASCESKQLREENIAGTLKGRDYKDGTNFIQIADYRMDEGLRIREDGNSPALNTMHEQSVVLLSDCGKGRKREKRYICPPLRSNTGRGNNDYVIQPVLTPNRKEKRQNGPRFKNHNNPMFTLTGQDQHGVKINNRIRRLTPIECERLQGFPDNWTAKGIDPAGNEVDISDSQRYKCCGNAVTVKVISAIAEKIMLTSHFK